MTTIPVAANSPNALLISQMIMHDHEVGRGNTHPKLFRMENYWMWKIRFVDYIRLTDMDMWLVITQGFDWPSYEKNGVIGRYTYADMPIEERKRYAIEGKALSTLTMALPQDSVHLFKKYTTSKDLWDALERYCEGDVTLKKNRIKHLKRQYEAFNGLKGESLDEIIIRFNHLTTELS